MPAKRLSPVFAALGDETRLQLVSQLREQPSSSISRLAFGSAISRQAITKHLHVLSKAGLVRGVRQGREQLYELDPRRFEPARQYLDRISREWDNRLNRLKLSVEGS